MTVNNFKEYFNAEAESIKKVLGEIKKLASLKPERMDSIKLAASGTFLHNFYNGIESIIKRAILLKGVKIKNSPGWHKETLIEAKSLNIISAGVHTKLVPFLTFRHYFIHGYSFKLRPEELLSLLKQADSVFYEFKKEIKKHFGL